MKLLSYLLFTILLSPLYTVAMQEDDLRGYSQTHRTETENAAEKFKSNKPKTAQEKIRQSCNQNGDILIQLIAQNRPFDAMLIKAHMDDDLKEAYNTYSYLSEMQSDEPWHAHALLNRACALEKGEGVRQDKKAALSYYQECFKKHKEPKALLAIARHYEEDATFLKNYELAAGFYKKAFSLGEPMAGYDYARLIYNEKIKPETQSEADEIIAYVRPAVKAGITEALYLFATVLLDNDREEFVEEGLPALFQAAKNGDAFSTLQIGIFFKNGLYVGKDTALAQKLFEKAFAMEDTPLNLLAQGYMHIHGIGVTRNVKLGQHILDGAQNSLSEINHIIKNLFSGAEKLGAILPTKEIKETSLEVKPSAQPEDKTKLNVEQPSALTPPTLSVQITKPAPALVPPSLPPAPKETPKTNIPKQLNYKTLLDKCNALSIDEDGSRIEIDMNNHNILVHDPKYNNEYSIPFEDEEFQWNINPKRFKYDPRIAIWHTKTLKELKADPDIRWKILTHRFGKAADYAIQLVGVKNPYLLKGKQDQERLVHCAESVNQKTKGHFEFTFYGSGKKKVLYHRHFKPYKTSPEGNDNKEDLRK